MHDIGSLLEVLRLARAEGALEGEGLEAFARGLRERADLVLEQEVAALRAELAALHAEKETATQAHDRLLAHHRDVLSRVAGELAAIAALPFYALRTARRAVAALAAAIRGEIA